MLSACSAFSCTGIHMGRNAMHLHSIMTGEPCMLWRKGLADPWMPHLLWRAAVGQEAA